MGGTDQMDGNVAKYRIGIRSKKWWWPIFTWLIDVSINNAWILMKSCGSSISQLNFKRNIEQTYLISYRTMPRGSGRPISSRSGGRVLNSTRYDNIGHYVRPVPMNKRRRCAAEPVSRSGEPCVENVMSVSV